MEAKMKRVAMRALMALSAAVMMALPAYAGERTFLSANAVAEGEGYRWDKGTLTLSGYDGGAFMTNSLATVVVLEGKNRISAGPHGFGLECDGALSIDGRGSGSLEVDSRSAGGISARESMEFKDMALKVRSHDPCGGIGILVGGGYGSGGRLVFDDVSGSITATSESDDPEERPEAVFSLAPIELRNMSADKAIGTLAKKAGEEEYAFVVGEGATYRDESRFEADEASSVLFVGDAVKAERPPCVIVRGETIDLRELHPLEPGQRYALGSKRDKRTARLKGWSLTGKRKGGVTVLAVDPERPDDDPDDDPAWAASVTVLRKPKLRLPKVAYEEGLEIDARERFSTEDTAFTVADSWESSDPSVAEVGPNGRIRVKGRGRAKITARFGNVKSSAALVVR